MLKCLVFKLRLIQGYSNNFLFYYLRVSSALNSELALHHSTLSIKVITIIITETFILFNYWPFRKKNQFPQKSMFHYLWNIFKYTICILLRILHSNIGYVTLTFEKPENADRFWKFGKKWRNTYTSLIHSFALFKFEKQLEELIYFDPKKVIWLCKVFFIWKLIIQHTL